MIDFAHRIAGMSYESASREGVRLIAEANKTGHWFGIGEKLNLLQATMERELRKGSK